MKRPRWIYFWGPAKAFVCLDNGMELVGGELGNTVCRREGEGKMEISGEENRICRKKNRQQVCLFSLRQMLQFSMQPTSAILTISS